MTARPIAELWKSVAVERRIDEELARLEAYAKTVPV
jgi:hypothetical protein